MAGADRTTAPRWLALRCTLFLWIVIGCHAGVHAQEDAVRAFRDAAAREEWPVARRLLQAAVRQSPARLVGEIDAVEFVLLDEPLLRGTVPGKVQADTLLLLYQAAIAASPATSATWKARRALLAMRFPRDYPLEALSYVREAVEADPARCPLHLYTLWMQTAAERYAQGQYPLKKFSLDGAHLGRLLYMRAITRPDEAEECERYARQLRHLLLARLPSCDALSANYRDGIQGGTLDLEGLQSYLAAHTLIHCDDRALFDAALRLGQGISPQDATLARLAAAEDLRRDDAEAALAHWEQALAWEKDPALAAGDLLFQSDLLALRQDYRGARGKVEAAMKLQPGWGAPYLRLVDLYLDGANACTATCRQATAGRCAVGWAPWSRSAESWMRHVDGRHFFLNIVGMENMSEQPETAPYPEILIGPRPWPMAWRVAWAVIGTLLVSSFFLPLFKVLSANFSGIQLINYLFEKDMEQVANLIGEFTTFLMYTAPLLAVATGVWVALQGFRAIIQGRGVRWVGSSALGASAFIVCLVCQTKLETPGGAFFFGKFMPKPAWGFYMDMALLLGLVVCGAIFAMLSRQPQPAQHDRA